MVCKVISIGMQWEECHNGSNCTLNPRDYPHRTCTVKAQRLNLYCLDWLSVGVIALTTWPDGVFRLKLEHQSGYYRSQ